MARLGWQCLQRYPWTTAKHTHTHMHTHTHTHHTHIHQGKCYKEHKLMPASLWHSLYRQIQSFKEHLVHWLKLNLKSHSQWSKATWMGSWSNCLVSNPWNSHWDSLWSVLYSPMFFIGPRQKLPVVNTGERWKASLKAVWMLQPPKAVCLSVSLCMCMVCMCVSQDILYCQGGFEQVACQHFDMCSQNWPPATRSCIHL